MRLFAGCVCKYLTLNFTEPSTVVLTSASVPLKLIDEIVELGLLDGVRETAGDDRVDPLDDLLLRIDAEPGCSLHPQEHMGVGGASLLTLHPVPVLQKLSERLLFAPEELQVRLHSDIKVVHEDGGVETAHLSDALSLCVRME